MRQRDAIRQHKPCPRCSSPAARGNASNRRLCSASGRANLTSSPQGRSHRWLIPHRSRPGSNAEGRSLLQQSPPNHGRVVPSGKRAACVAASHLVRRRDRHSTSTASGAPGDSTARSLDCLAPGALPSRFLSGFLDHFASDFTFGLTSGFASGLTIGMLMSSPAPHCLGPAFCCPLG